MPKDKGYGVEMWSKSHKANVANGKVDKASVKGIWHSNKEAWAGIDDIFPTDTPVSSSFQDSCCVLYLGHHSVKIVAVLHHAES